MAGKAQSRGSSSADRRDKAEGEAHGACCPFALLPVEGEKGRMSESHLLPARWMGPRACALLPVAEVGGGHEQKN